MSRTKSVIWDKLEAEEQEYSGHDQTLFTGQNHASLPGNQSSADENNFRKIDRFPSYLFSECGNIYSIRSKRFLKPLMVSNGYTHVCLVEKGIKYRKTVHRLIAEAFHGMPRIGEVVNHKNGVKHDNRAENMEWVSQSYNVKHAYLSGARIINKEHKDRCALLGKAKRKTTDAMEQSIKDAFTGKRGDITRLAKQFNVSRFVIARIIKD
jgi:hypothetical protein